MLTEWLGVVYLTPSAAGGAAVAAIWERIHVLAVRFKSIKQDRRIERPEARGRHRPRQPPLGGIPGDGLDSLCRVVCKWYAEGAAKLRAASRARAAASGSRRRGCTTTRWPSQTSCRSASATRRASTRRAAA